MTKSETRSEISQDTATVAATYFRAWEEKDWTTLRSVLADDAESCVDGLKGMSQIMTDVVIHKTFVDGPDIVTWFDLHTSVAPPAPTANWSHVENGKITTIRVTFDTRPLVP